MLTLISEEAYDVLVPSGKNEVVLEHLNFKRVK